MAVAPQKKKKKKKKGERERKKENKAACMHDFVKLPPFNHFQSKIKYKFVLYEEYTGHMHQIAPLTTSKCKKLSLWEGGTPLPHPPPLARSGSVASLPRTLFFTAPLKLNPGYTTAPHATILLMPASEGHKPKCNENSRCGFCPSLCHYLGCARLQRSKTQA